MLDPNTRWAVTTASPREGRPEHAGTLRLAPHAGRRAGYVQSGNEDGALLRYFLSAELKKERMLGYKVRPPSRSVNDDLGIRSAIVYRTADSSARSHYVRWEATKQPENLLNGLAGERSVLVASPTGIGPFSVTGSVALLRAA